MATHEDQMQAWQQRLDRDFPDGVLIMPYRSVEVDEDGDEPIEPVDIYRSPRVEVLRMLTPFSPEVRYETSMGMTVKDAVRAIDTYYVEQSEPCKIVRVTFTDGEVRRFSGNLSDKAKKDLARKEW